jgi:hypothetical protein
MSYRTLEVQIDHGRIVTQDSERLPDKGSGLLTILEPEPRKQIDPRPFGLAKGQFVVPADFNAPLPEEILRDFAEM